MPRYHIVTTCSAAGWEQTGRKMLASYLTRWPGQVRFTVYVDGFEIDRLHRAHGVKEKNLPIWVDMFKARHANNEAAKGQRLGRYDFKFDAVKFCHKVGAVDDATETIETDVLIWMDCDTYTHSPIDMPWLDQIAPTDAVLSWLDRDGLYPECGFLMFNVSNGLQSAARTVARAWASQYITDDVFKLREWHDSYVLEQVVKALKVPTKSLSGHAARTSHPFINGVLGEKLDHCKGPRKNEGHSRAGDLKTNRTEDYWRKIVAAETNRTR